MKGIIVLILALVAFQAVKAEDLAPQNTACDACQYVVGLVENYIDANYTVDQITNFLEQWCDYVPQFAQICDQVVQYGIQDFIAYVETNEDPSTFCKQVQLCNTVVAEPTQGGNCAICEYVITLVENYVTSNTTIDEFVSVLDNYCSMVPGLAQVCDQLVQYGVDDLLAYIQADLSPQQVCTLAKLCTSEQKEIEVPAVTPTLGDNCSTCTFVVSLIESYVENNGTINQIIADVEKACSIIPGIQPICDQLVAAGIQQIINYINQDLSPTQICTLLKLCSSNIAVAVPEAPVVAVPQVGDATCDTCQYVVTIIESYVEDNATVDEIEQKLQAACNVIPGIGPICQEFIDYGIQEIVNYINADLTPLQVCTLIKLCSNEVAVMAPTDTNCDLCKYVVGIVEEWLESNATIAQAVTRLDALCTYVPGFEAVCEQVVQMGVKEFVTFVQTNEQPDTVCTQISLCTSRTCGTKAPVMQTRVKTL